MDNLWHELAHARTIGACISVFVCGVGCGGDVHNDPVSIDSCEIDADWNGADYDVTRSKFAFGSTPVKMSAGRLTRWVGSQGVIATDASGSTLGVMNGGAPESDVEDWSSDTDALSEHVRDYFVSMGVAECQIARTDILGGSSGKAVDLVRAADEIVIAESNAYARFNAHDLTTSEGLYWPTIPARVVAEARVFRAQLADADGLASFKSKLPAEAQGEGLVIIHHTPGASTQAFAAVATYDVIRGRTTLSFSLDAQSVELPQ